MRKTSLKPDGLKTNKEKWIMEEIKIVKSNNKTLLVGTWGQQYNKV